MFVPVISLCVVWFTLRMEFEGELRLENNCRDVFLHDVLSGLDVWMDGVDAFTLASMFLDCSGFAVLLCCWMSGVGIRRAETTRAVVGADLESAKFAGVGANRGMQRRDDGATRLRDIV